MSFDWNLSSDEDEAGEDGFADWANVDLKESIGGYGRTGHSDSDDSDDESDDGNKKPAAVVFDFGGAGANADGNNDDDEDGIDWEDAEDGMGGDGGMNDGGGGVSANVAKLPSDNEAGRTSGGPPMISLRPITINLNKRPPDDKANARPKKRVKRSYRFDHLPQSTKHAITALQRSHLLCLAATATSVSERCSSDMLQSVAYSLIPEQWTTIAMPTKMQLLDFTKWFCGLVNNAQARRRDHWMRASRAGVATMRRRRPAAGGKTKSSKAGGGENDADNDDELSSLLPLFSSSFSSFNAIPSRTEDYCLFLALSLDDDPELEQMPTPNPPWGTHDKLQLYTLMVRALCWRARFVMSIDPIKGDLDVNHPMLVQDHLQHILFHFGDLQKRNNKEKKKRPTRDDGTAAGKQAPGQSEAKRQATNNDDDGSGKKRATTAPALDAWQAKSQNDHAFKPTIAWVEVLCSKRQAQGKTAKSTTSPNKMTSSVEWVHVDPHWNLFNQPSKVEYILFNADQQMELRNQEMNPELSSKRRPIAYALAVEHAKRNGDGDAGAFESSSPLVRKLTDVTPRYASSYIESMKAIGVLRGKQTKVKEQEDVHKWWKQTLKSLSSSHRRPAKDKASSTLLLRKQGKSASEAIDLSDDQPKPKEDDGSNGGAHELEHEGDEEEAQLSEHAKKEPLPTSKQGFKEHPVYVIPSLLGNAEVLMPDAKKRVCGVFKGELVYRRTDVTTLHPANKWPYRGRKVRKEEMSKPTKRIKARKKPAVNGFKALRSYGVGQNNDGTQEQRLKEIAAAEQPLADGKEDVYAIWQTDPWSPPPIGPDDRLPINEFRNIELELLNPGLVHVDESNIAKVAKQLGIPYAPCLMGFEGFGGNRAPTIRGIVVHQHNEILLREAHAEVASHLLQESHDEHQRRVYARWKRLLVGMLTKERLEREYGE